MATTTIDFVERWILRETEGLTEADLDHILEYARSLRSKRALRITAKGPLPRCGQSRAHVAKTSPRRRTTK